MDERLPSTKRHFLAMLEYLLDSRIVTSSEISRYLVGRDGDQSDPEQVRIELEEWYRHLGIESIIKRKFSLSPCPFSATEISKAVDNDEAILCVPAGVDRRQLAELFRMHSWALTDPLVTPATEPEDLWFRTSLAPQPSRLKGTGLDIKHVAEAGLIHFSLERYLVFSARYLALQKRLPDDQYWIWLPHKAYDRSGMLMAGFDRFGSLSVHGWMPQFSASFLGARYGYQAGI